MCFYDEKTQTLQDPLCVDDVLNQRPDLTNMSQGSFTIIVAPNNFCAFFVQICDNRTIVAIFVALSHQAT